MALALTYASMMHVTNESSSFCSITPSTGSSCSASGSGAFLDASPSWSGSATLMLDFRLGSLGRFWPESECTRLTTEVVISRLGR